MKLDITNSQNLDVSPFVDRYSNATAIKPRVLVTSSAIVPKSTTLAAPKTTTEVAPPRSGSVTIAQQPVLTNTGGTTTGTVILQAPIGTIVPAYSLPVEPVMSVVNVPTSTMPTATNANVPPVMGGGGATGGGATSGGATGGGAMGGGAMGGGAMGGGNPEEEQEGTEQEGDDLAKRQSEIQKTTNDKSKNIQLLGLLIGAAGGYFYANKANKNLIAYTVIGSAIGLGLGFLIQKKD